MAGRLVNAPRCEALAHDDFGVDFHRCPYQARYLAHTPTRARAVCGHHRRMIDDGRTVIYHKEPPDG